MGHFDIWSNLYQVTFPYRALFTFPSMLFSQHVVLDFIKYVDKKMLMAHISLLRKAFTKTKPVLKAKFAHGFNGIPYKVWTSCWHDIIVMFPWHFMKKIKMSWKHDHDIMTVWFWNLLRHSIKTACKFCFWNRFCFCKCLYQQWNMDCLNFFDNIFDEI